MKISIRIDGHSQAFSPQTSGLVSAVNCVTFAPGAEFFTTSPFPSSNRNRSSRPSGGRGTAVGTLLGVALLTGLAEEPGWRGYAQPTANRRYQPLVAALVVSLIWAAWHLPNALFGPSLSGSGAIPSPVAPTTSPDRRGGRAASP